MFDPKRVFRFWWHVLQLALPICAAAVLLMSLGFLITGWPDSPRQLAVRLLVGLLPWGMALLAALVLCTSFMQALYAPRRWADGFWFLIHCLFGQATFKPWMLVEEGKLSPEYSDPNSLLARAGGPGNLIVRKDSAVVLEAGGKLTRVAGPGRTKLGRFERVYDTLDLRPLRWQLEVSGMSKEGVPVTCEAEVVFQLSDAATAPTVDVPYPWTQKSVFGAATSKWRQAADWPSRAGILDWRGLLVEWHTDRTLRSIMARFPLDRLVAPSGRGAPPSRHTIRAELETELNNAARRVGARLIKVDLGQLAVKDEVTQQWIDGWQAEWDRWEAEYSATADAEYLETVGSARADAVARRVSNTTDILHALALSGSERSFHSGVRMQLYLMLKQMPTDPLILTYFPAEALKIIETPLP